MKRLALMFVVVAGLLALWCTPALAHNSLVESAPAKDARLAAPPAEVKLRFLSNVDKSAKLMVIDAAGASAIGAVSVDGKFLSAPFTATAPGTYTISYELASSDGHPIKGSFSFGIDAPPAPPTPSAAPVAQAEPTPTGLAEAAPPTKKDRETPWFPYIGGAAIAGLAVGGLLAFIKRRRLSR
ncbi:MAG TPA: copper resistance CopC family protein [Candidatus Limnocylindrales bacterium]|nr:copper resistance CopC family protein [Candidatus Limnocylindrales bacterium]